MKPLRVTFTAVLALVMMTLLISCDTMMVSQYRITSVAAPSQDREKLLEALAHVASRLGLVEVTNTSTIKNTLVFYSQPEVKNFQVQLGARTVGNAVIVDLTGGFGPMTARFKEAKKALMEEMERSLAGRYEIPSPHVPIREPIPAPLQTPG